VEFPQRLNYAASQPPLGNAQPAAEKEPSGSAGAARESGVLPPPNSASSQSATSVSQAVARDDHAAASLALPVKSQGTGSAAPVIGLVPATTQVSAGVFQGQDGYGMAMTVTPELSHPFGSPLPFGNQYAGSEPSFLAATLVPPAALLTNVLPVDVASLESSIKDFFDQIDHAGLKLSESQLGLLFSSGTLAVAAMLALEIARRQVQRHPAPALTPRREGSIPYSDYP
jgi:hypothetical protein